MTDFVKEDVIRGLEGFNVDSLSLLTIISVEPEPIERTGGWSRLQGSSVVTSGSGVPYMLNHRVQLICSPEDTGGGPLWEEDVMFSLYTMMQLCCNAPCIAEPTQLESHDVSSCYQGMLVALVMPALNVSLYGR